MQRAIHDLAGWRARPPRLGPGAAAAGDAEAMPPIPAGPLDGDRSADARASVRRGLLEKMRNRSRRAEPRARVPAEQRALQPALPGRADWPERPKRSVRMHWPPGGATEPRRSVDATVQDEPLPIVVRRSLEPGAVPVRPVARAVRRGDLPARVGGSVRATVRRGRTPGKIDRRERDPLRQPAKKALDADLGDEALRRKAEKRNVEDIIKRRQQRDAERAKFRRNAKRRRLNPVIALLLASATVVAVIMAITTFQKYFGRQRGERLPGALRR
jgi:hypothetical protein